MTLYFDGKRPDQLFVALLNHDSRSDEGVLHGSQTKTILYLVHVHRPVGLDADPDVPPILLQPHRNPYSEFKEAVAAGTLIGIAVSRHVLHGKMKDDKAFITIRIEDPDLLRSLSPAR